MEDLPSLEPDLLERVVTVVDGAAASRGWFASHLLVRIEQTLGTVDVGVRELPDGAHPLDELWGFRAPRTWMALGIVAYGWAWPPRADGGGPRRVRLVVLVDRLGNEAATASLDDGTVVDDRGEGALVDVLRRCLGLPTAPPPPLARLHDVLWLAAVRDEARRAPVTWPTARRLRAATRPPGWHEVRLGLSSRWSDDGWMDDGFFARQLLATLPRVDELLYELDGLVGCVVLQRLRAAVGT